MRFVHRIDNSATTKERYILVMTAAGLSIFIGWKQMKEVATAPDTGPQINRKLWTRPA
jgi:hypothetical protein